MFLQSYSKSNYESYGRHFLYVMNGRESNFNNLRLLPSWRKIEYHPFTKKFSGLPRHAGPDHSWVVVIVVVSMVVAPLLHYGKGH